MNTDLVQIEFYFPNETNGIKDKKKLADLILDMMRKRKSIEYAGFSNEKVLHESILKHLGNADVDQYKLLSESRQHEIKECIEKTVLGCNAYLPVPTKNYVFVFPYLPTEKDAVFGGIMGFTPYSCVFYIFVSPELWSPKVLANTVAHELNHTIFYYYHFDNLNNYTLLDEMILEGLAENFKEHVIDKTPAPWAIALTQEKSLEVLEAIDEKVLYSKDSNLIRGVLFGNDKYERWTGYSIGYWLVKKLLRKKSDLSWEAIMKLQSKKILEIVRK